MQPVAFGEPLLSGSVHMSTTKNSRHFILMHLWPRLVTVRITKQGVRPFGLLSVSGHIANESRAF